MAAYSYTPQYYSTGVPIPGSGGKLDYGYDVSSSSADAYAGGEDDESYYHYPGHQAPSSGGGSAYSVSPPESSTALHCGGAGGAASVVSSGGPSYSSIGPSATTSAAGGHGHGHGRAADDYYSGSYYADSSSGGGSASGVDFNEYMQERFADTFDPIPLDRSLAVQAQTSGSLNAKHRELLDLQAKAQARLAKSRARFAEGLQDAREVRADLEWTSKKVSSLKKKAEKKHSREYQRARQRYPSPEY